MSLSRQRAAELARETLAILDAGEYRSPSGTIVSIREQLREAIEATESFPPERPLAMPGPGTSPTRITVDRMTTLEAITMLAAEEFRPAALNFASAKHPGGGFLRGSRAQEESLARSSGLYACIASSPMYEFHREQRDVFYSHYAIYSPGVPILRADDGRLLEQPIYVAFLTAPAVNAGVAIQRDPSRRPAIRATMAERTARVLAIAALKGHDALVLGAWGCGVFGNDPRVIAEVFRDALAGPFRGVFARVVFAIVDPSSGGPTVDIFRRVLAELVDPQRPPPQGRIVPT